ncbi:MAG: universal stress protein [Proteobacteria bacterium]|nr:MAG: universal stress protein [Pseudomonadota bacterium]QKK11314.1 MAG: universal stress protein [Pseudomonadota bacterium]
MSIYKHLLLALDFSPESAYIGQRAKQLADQCGASVVLIHVVEHVPLDLSNDLILAQPVDIDSELIEDARGKLAELADTLGLAAAEQRVELGATKNEILRVAEEAAADLIVVGSHGRHGLALLMGSTANAVLHGAKCDVLAIRVPTEGVQGND